MVNREKYHGFYAKLEDYLNLSEYEILNIPLINLRNFVRKNIPEVFNEMISQDRFKDWIADDIETCLIDIIEYGGKKVGFVAYDLANIKAISIGKVYILEKYRGKGIFGDYLWKLQDWRVDKLKQDMNNNFIIEISEPNFYTIKSLIKSKMIIPLPNIPQIYVGLLIFFNISLAKQMGDKKSFTTMTPFYSLELGSPVGVFDNELVYSGMSFIDDEDFNISVSRNEFLNNPVKVNNLKEGIKSLSTQLGELALAEVGDCSHIFDR